MRPDDNEEFVAGDFKVASTTEAEEVTELESLITGDNAEHRLLAAMTLEAYGAADEALRLYERLWKATPEDCALCLVCARLYQRAGRAPEAKAMRIAAERLGWKSVEAEK